MLSLTVSLGREVGMVAAVLYGLVQLGKTVWTVLPPSQQAATVRSVAARVRRLSVWLAELSSGYEDLACAIEAGGRSVDDIGP